MRRLVQAYRHALAGLRLGLPVVLALLFVFTTAGVPMVTYLCGTGDEIVECRMPDCESPRSDVVSFEGPACCTPSVTEGSTDDFAIPATDKMLPVSDVCAWGSVAGTLHTSVHTELHPAAPSPLPLFLQHSSLLI